MSCTSKNIFILSNTSKQITLMKNLLVNNYFNVTSFNSFKKMANEVKNKKPFLIIIELDFFEKDGITITSEIRKETTYNPFIILFTNKVDEYVQITALNAGADDLIKIPLNTAPLIARIKAYSNRFKLYNNIKINNLNNENFVVDREKYAVFINAQPFLLPRKEFEILYLLQASPQKIFSRSEIGTIVWGSAEVSKTRTIDIHIRNIRQIIGNNYILTKKNVGYSFFTQL